ncbi:MAG TPA: hypothetical protein VK249_34455 [Anaerolineales bacterium]|nr:hypothetical protein [Anaerolineales bacterium]
MFYRILRILDFLALMIALIIAAGGDASRPTDTSDRVRFSTRDIEFDYPNWVWNAAWLKVDQASVGLPYLFDRATNKKIVTEYLRTTQSLIQADSQIEKIFADPGITDKEASSAYVRAQRDQLAARQNSLAPLAEAALQSQISDTLAEVGLTTIGQPVPPVLYHISSTPLALIVSSRSKIEQIANISIEPTLSLDDQIKLEDQVAHALNVSTLVVGTGGIGVYPTMVMETTDLQWTLSTIAHEWTHNYLNLRPLGLNYGTTPQLRTMNETTADIVGNEVGQLVVQKYYPELLPSTQSGSVISLHSSLLLPNGPADPTPFDFRAEMHETRVTTDKLLAEGKIDEAESYMEQRRQLFWKNGYLIRKLNQAYFAFHGAYADVPGGAAGEDPVGPAVRALRAQSASLKDFVNTIAWMTSFEQLQQAIHK